MAGLTADPTSIKDSSNDPGVSYVKNPSINCRIELNLLRQKMKKEEAKKSESLMDQFVNQQTRYVERENLLIAEANDINKNAVVDDKLRTQTQLLKQRKDEYLAYNNITFANKVYELPKFSKEEGEKKKWWLKQRAYNSTEVSKSAKEFYLKKMSRGKPDPIALADH